ncbi:MAG TPA: DUF3606 domain-containing protein [Casimicrobiaceae bacterium]|nr:DUF3606 domain-containing protein [Casimicrobiaceae bacterium]
MTDENVPSYRDADMREVDVNDPYAVRWWCQRLICTESMLRAAVGKVGPRCTDVARQLRASARPLPRGRPLRGATRVSRDR